MAAILLINCNRLVSGVQYLGISSISAFLKKAGHDVIFFDTAEYASNKDAESYNCFKDNKSRINLEFKHIKDVEAMPVKRPIELLLIDLKNEILNHRIDVVGFSSFSDDWPFTLFLIRKIRSLLSNVPIIVGGIHATVAPEQVIKHPEVDMICLGEGEEPIVELLNCIDDGDIKLSIKNLWLKHNGKIHRNPMRSLLQFTNDFPIPDWSLYNDIHFYYPFEGELFRRGSISIGRGCPHYCNFCINSYLKHIYAKEKNLMRFKPIDYFIREISYLRNKYKLEFIRFWDESFLALPRMYFSELVRAYKKEIGLPFTIETTAQTLNHENARLLAEMGCLSVSIGVETSNETLRAKILNKPIPNEAYERCFKIATEYGLRKVANFMFFLPHQTIADMWRDVYLCRKWKINHASARFFYPYVGTSLRDYCVKNDLLDLDILKRIEDEESIRQVDDLNNAFVTFQGIVLKANLKDKQEARMILDNFVLFQETSLSRHDELKRLLFTEDNADSDIILRDMERKVYKKRFKEEPIVVC